MSYDHSLLERIDLEKHITVIMDKEVCMGENDVKILCDKVKFKIFKFIRPRRF
jgi:hypothetical protein